MSDQRVYIVEEVNNYGGFFAGDTITLTASPLDAPDERRDFTIDDYAFDNLRDRYQVTAGVALELETNGDKVVHAHVVGARTREQVRIAVIPDAGQPGPVRVLAYRCRRCELWVAGPPPQDEEQGYICGLCHQPLSRRPDTPISLKRQELASIREAHSLSC